MKLAFDKQKLMLAHMNVRSEVHGDQRQGATDLKFHVMLQNDCLAMFHPYLKTALYTKEAPKTGPGEDLADKASDAPHLRMPDIEWPMKWKGAMIAAKFKVKKVGDKDMVSAADVKINGAHITAKDGGIIDLTFRAQFYPNEEQFGKLATMVQQEVELTIVPGEEVAAE